MKQELKERFDENLARVKNLALIYEEKLAGDNQGRRPVGSTDILRAAVVLLHATMEEYIRGILEWLLPMQPEAVLNSVPLVGEKGEKFPLGRLVAHRTKTVDALIRESVAASLTRSNYNNTTEIVAALTSVGINPAPYQPCLDKIGEMTQRRHQIVHKADRNPHHGQGHHPATSIGRHHVETWAAAVQNLFDAVHLQLP